MYTNAEKIYRKYNSTDDEAWKDVVRKSVIDPMIGSIAFPLVPDEKIQCHFAGAPLVKNVHVAYQYYKAIKDTYESKIKRIDEQTKFLDVGSGWGRVIRFFMKDIAPSNLSGCDVSSWSIDICNSCFRGELNFQLINSLPPTPYADDYFDIVEGCSIFTHLSYYAVLLWMYEYFRILKPGGMLAMTVWKQCRFDYIRKLQSEPPRSPESDKYNYTLQSSFSRDCELEEDLYKKTGAVYIPYVSNPAATYGEAFISPDLLVSQWSSFFEHITNFELDGDQQIVFLRKKPDVPKINRETLREIANVAKMYDIQTICVNNYNKKMRTETEINCQGKLAEIETLLNRGETQLSEKTRQVDELLDSASWRITGPLRRAYDIMLKLSRRK